MGVYTSNPHRPNPAPPVISSVGSQEEICRKFIIFAETDHSLTD